MSLQGISAFQGRRNWQQVRADRAMELNLVLQRQKQIEDDLRTEQMAQAGVQEYFDSINEASVLEQDLDRVREMEKGKRKNIISMMRDAGGDTRKFLAKGGSSALASYKRDVLTSEQMVTALKNKTNHTQYQLDRYLGREARPVQQEDGSYRDFAEILAEFQSGDRVDLPYDGSAQPVAFDPRWITSRYADPNNPLIGRSATDQDIMEAAMAFGNAEPWQAERIASEYAGFLNKGAAPLNFRTDRDPYAEERLRIARITESATDPAPAPVDIVAGLLNGTDGGYRPTGQKVGGLELFAHQGVGSNILNSLANSHGFTLDEESGEWVPDLNSKTFFVPTTDGMKQVDLGFNDIKSERQNMVTGVRGVVVHDGQPYLQVDLTVDKAKFLGSREDRKKILGFQDRKGARFGVGGNYDGQAYIRLESTPQIIEEVSKAAGLGDKRRQSEQFKSRGIQLTAAEEQQHQLQQLESARNAGLQLDTEGLQRISDAGYGEVFQQMQTNPFVFSSEQLSEWMNEAVGASNNLNLMHLIALGSIESSNNTNAVGPTADMGWGQLSPETARDLGVSNPFDAQENISASARYFDAMMGKYESEILAYMAYNAGPGKVDDYIAKAKAITPEGESWENYIFSEHIIPAQVRQNALKYITLYDATKSVF